MSPIDRLRAKWRAAQAANADIDDCQPMWPWWLCGIASFAIVSLLFAGCFYLRSLATANPPSLTPTIEDHHGR